MKTPITKERWENAQEKEKNHHVGDVNVSYDHYQKGYEHCFKFLEIDKDLKGKSIVEIGPARISALLFCKNYSKSYIIEPTIYGEVSSLYEGKNIEIISDLAENCNFPSVDEVWLLNLMQHVQNPDLLIEICKKNSKVIRFFEPVETEINDEHPFSFTMDDYFNYFGKDCVKEFKNTGEKNFHTAKCAYGIYLTGK